MQQGRNWPRPIFHIGYHKTATNWFQKHFYPAVEGHRFVDRKLVRSTLLGGSPLAFDAAAAREALGIDGGEPVIICEEDLSGVLHNAGLGSNYIAKEQARQLHALAPDAQVVIFVRSQAAMAASCYLQYLREGGTASARRYLFPESYRHLGNVRPLKVPRFDFTQFDYDRLVAHYDSLFGRANVHVFAFEAFARDRDAFLDRFARTLGFTRPQLAGAARPNESYRRGLIPLARFMNLFTARSVAEKWTLVHLPYWYTVRKYLLEQLNRLAVFGRRPRPRDVLGDDICSWIEHRFAEGNRALAGRMGEDLAALGYCLTPRRDSPPPTPARSPLLAWVRN